MAHEILIQTVDGATEKVLLQGDRLAVGRSRDNDFHCPDDASLSRRHMVLERKGEEWVVRDLESKNGTYLNGARIQGPQPLRAGDRIRAGDLVLVFDPAGREVTAENVVFYAEPEWGAPRPATVTLRLDGLLRRETGPAAGADPPAAAAAAVPPAGPAPAVSLQSPAVGALIRAGRELAGHRPLPELFRMILDLSLEAVGADRGVLMTLEGEQLVPRAVRGEGFRISTAVRDQVLREKNSLLVRDTRLDEAFRSRQSILAQDVRTMMAVPLQTEDRVIGLVYVDSPHLVREFTPDDLNLLTVLGNVAATRIEHERLQQVEQAQQLLERDLEQAAEIQRMLLPAAPPVVPGVELAGHNAACRTVGGDYYDFLPCPEGRVALVLGDVSGKGIPAALLMASLQARIQALAEEPCGPGRLLGRLNRMLAASSPTNRFVSLFFCVLDPRSGEMAWSNAGHNPPMLVRAGGRVERLEGGGMVLGVVADSTYEESRTLVEPGDLLALYSDGLTEARSPGDEEYGEGRLAEILREGRGRPLPEVIETAKAAVAAWRGGAPPEDDVTLVLARRTA